MVILILPCLFLYLGPLFQTTVDICIRECVVYYASMKSMAGAVLPVLSKYFRPTGSKIRPRGLKEIQHHVLAYAH